jgi:cytochrome c
MRKFFIPAAFVAVSLAPSHALAGGDAAKGEAVFKICKACHDIEAGVSRLGPTLKGIVGRTAATAANYSYSKALTGKGAEGLVWTEDNLAAYLADPKGYLPGSKMAFAGIKNADKLADLIAYLKANP